MPRVPMMGGYFREPPSATAEELLVIRRLGKKSFAISITESTVKKYVQEIFEKLGVETRGAAIVRTLEVLNSQPSRVQTNPSTV